MALVKDTITERDHEKVVNKRLFKDSANVAVLGVAIVDQNGDHAGAPATETKQDALITAVGLVAKDATVATAAKQDDIVTALGLVAKDATVSTEAKQDNLITAVGLVAKDATVATAAKQDDLITAVGLVAKDATVATAAKQDTGNTSVAAIDTKLGDGSARVVSRPYEQAIAEGDISGHTSVRLRGEVQNATSAWTDMWGGAPATPIVPLLAATISAEVVSSSIQDAVGGTGAGKVQITYLTTGGALVSEDITLLGTNPVALSQPLLHVQKICIVEGGTSVTTLAAGTIDVRLVGGAATVYARIPVGSVCAPRVVFRVPAAQTLYLSHINAFGLALANNSDMQIRLVANVEQGVVLPQSVWQTIWKSGGGPGGNAITGPVPATLKIIGDAIVKAQARRVGGSGNCDASIAAYGWRE